MNYKQGDIVVIPFPFTDLSQRKRRPALVISNDTVNTTGDYLLAQITSKNRRDKLSVAIVNDDYQGKPLPIASYVRIHKLFCLNESLIEKKVSVVTESFVERVNQKINTLLQTTANPTK